MLRRIVIREIHSFLDRPRAHDDALRDRRPHDLDAREPPRLLVDLALDRAELLVAHRERNEDDLRVDAMLRLREEVRRDERRIGLLVRDDEDSTLR